MNVFGTRSLEVRAELHEDLQKIMDGTILACPVDIGLHGGGRKVGAQQRYFDEGKSRINPSSYTSVEALCEKAKHIIIDGHPKFSKSRAVDFHVAESFHGRSLAWDQLHIGVVVGCMMAVTWALYDAGEITHLLRSGLDWDGDGVFDYDQ